MVTPVPVDFQAMLAEARREAAEKRRQQTGGLPAQPSSLSIPEERRPTHPSQVADAASPPATRRAGLRRLTSTDCFNLLQTPLSGQAADPVHEQQATPQDTVRRPLLVDLRDEALYRVCHVRQAVHGAALLRDLRMARRRETPGQLSNVSLPETIVFLASSREENEVFKSFSQAAGVPEAGAGRRLDAGPGETEATNGGTVLKEHGEQWLLGSILEEIQVLLGKTASRAAAFPGETRDGLQLQPQIRESRPNPRLFWLEDGFAAFWNSFPFLCLSAEDEDAAAAKMNATAAAALMSYPREIHRRSCLVSVHPTQRSAGGSQPLGERLPDTSPVQGVYLGCLLHAMSRGIRRRLRIETILDLSSEGLPATCGACNCQDCATSGCRSRARGASRNQTRGGAVADQDAGTRKDACFGDRQTPEESRGAAEKGEQSTVILESEETVRPLRVIRAVDLVGGSGSATRGNAKNGEAAPSRFPCPSPGSAAAAAAILHSSLPLDLCVDVIRGGLGDMPLNDAAGRPPAGAGSSAEERTRLGGEAPPDEESRAGEARGSVLVVHSGDLRSVSAASTVVAAFLAAENMASDSSLSQSKTVPSAGSCDRASLALARLMRRCPATRLESQHLQQLQRFCERMTRAGRDGRQRQLLSSGVVVEASWAVAHGHREERSASLAEDGGSGLHSENEKDENEGRENTGGRDAAEDASSELRAARDMTLDLCRLPSEPVFLVPRTPTPVSSAARGEADGADACESDALTPLLWRISSVFDKRGVVQQPDFPSKKEDTHTSSSATSEDAGDATQRLVCGFASLLSRIQQSSSPSRSPSSRATSTTESASRGYPCANASRGLSDVGSFSLTEWNVRTRLFELAADAWRQDKTPAESSLESEVAIPVSSAWDLLANCVGCWAARLMTQSRGQEAEQEGEPDGARASRLPAARATEGAPVSSLDRVAVSQGLCQMLETTLRHRAPDVPECSTGVGAYLLNLTLLRMALDRSTYQEKADAGEHRRPEEAKPGDRQVSKREADEQKRLKKLLVSFLVEVAGREAAAFLTLECDGFSDSSHASRREISESPHTERPSLSLAEPEDGEETLLGRPTRGLCLALTALYGAFIKPLFLDVCNAAPAIREKSRSGRGNRKDKEDKSKKRLKDLFKTESMAAVLRVAEVWSAKHPTEGFEALQMLERFQANDTEENVPCAESFPLSLGVILRPLVLVASEIEGSAE
ncbi:conserved hypothetical protein [Neospora caninum Liverpool]|uniref:Uncharacterized protein n=1 Tax=Neospora caninum (strain Liverpool) TaxID=572307 RepID=F0VBD9_NEOCL|nr:conserved hypothetical protein [Neospora caninum Liverpool]CBZ50923.1 conserved hypothetical protein [Neospora caninum Liverpool]CEL68224.1 TPA: hypothetical protein BN1204_039980 [Neospora caninum Liverpool]|eukprot:XP_003880956.1 conserved hypothetical protein [Neospora caninum Liverpool]